ncbi:MAG: hypothetical protein ACI9HK_000509, partial [Pirellulaceae bacterium]
MQETQPTLDDNTELYPPPWVFVACGVLVVVAAVLQFDVLERGDLANIFTLLCGMGSILLPLLWLAFRSHLPLTYRTSPLLVLVVAVAIFFFFNKIHAVDGDLTPQFKSRWTPEVDETLSSHSEIATEIVADSPDFSIRSKGDFPQFLGASRRCEANHVELISDWNESHPKEIWKHEIGAGWSGCA